MQKAGDSTQESAFSANNSGLARWFEDGFFTTGVDWTAFEEHLVTVPDLAFETTTGNHENVPKGVSALHLAVACINPSAPLSLIQRLIDANPDALHQTEDQRGWNVLHCLLKFNRNIKANLLDALLDSRPDLVNEGATSIDDYGFPPLAYVRSPELVPKLVKLMSPRLVASLLKKIFMKRKLLAGSVQTAQQIIQELSQLELQQNRSILATAIVPEKLQRKQSLIKYVLIQTSKCGRNTTERADLKRLTDPIIQATYRFHFRTSDEIDPKAPLASSPPALECLKALLAKQKLGQKVLGLYSSVMTDNAEYLENLEFMEPEGLAAATMGSEGNENIIGLLLKSKEELDSKIEHSLETVRLAAVSLENYKTKYSEMVERATTEAQSSNTDTFPAPANTHSLPPVGALSISPPTPSATILDTIENMKAAFGAVDQFTQKISTDSANLLHHQEALETVDLSYFRSPLHDQAVHAMASIAESQIEKVGIQKCLDELKSQLKEAEGEKKDTARRDELNLQWATLSGELRELTRKIENDREVVTNRRQDVGGHMIKARRLLKAGGPGNKMVKKRAARFLREAKKEMKELMSCLLETAPHYKPILKRQRRKIRKWKQQQQQQQLAVKQQKTVEEDDELNRLTKRMKL